MACNSMTGFGQAVHSGNRMRVKVEIRCVNHRFAEFNVRMPRELFALEEEVRAVLGQYIARGRADLYLSAEQEALASKEAIVDWPLFDRLLEAETTARNKYPDLPVAPASLGQWLGYPGVIEVSNSSYDLESIRSVALTAVHQACSELAAMRSREGERLSQDMLAKCKGLAVVVASMAQRAPEALSAYRERVASRIGDLGVALDEGRVLAEIALMAERIGIDEELVRLQSHLAELEKTLVQASPIGRRLDFIIQEMHREVNTIGSKSADLLLSKAVVDAKTIVEQLREQAQNIE